MNIIKTVGDLKRALSVYDDSLPFHIIVYTKDARQIKASLNNDTLLYKQVFVSQSGEEYGKCFVITGLED